jgi:hypothetical protein
MTLFIVYCSVAGFYARRDTGEKMLRQSIVSLPGLNISHDRRKELGLAFMTGPRRGRLNNSVPIPIRWRRVGNEVRSGIDE